MTEEKCKGCRFFLPTDQERGLCRRYPATVFLLDMKKVEKKTGASEDDQSYIEQKATTMFPTMMNAGWCGEYKPKKIP